MDRGGHDLQHVFHVLAEESVLQGADQRHAEAAQEPCSLRYGSNLKYDVVSLKGASNKKSLHLVKKCLPLAARKL